jgi:PAS domain S-box-containing protein
LMTSMKYCWQHLGCDHRDCPVFQQTEQICWLVSGTRCHGGIQGSFFKKIQLCLDCVVFKQNMTRDLMEKTCRLLSRQFSTAEATLQERDGELEAVSMEMAIGLSEVFGALKKIAAGDPGVHISEDSNLELIAELKRLVNRTAQDMGETVELLHEFAMGLAEHFDVLHRVSAGALDARVTGPSKVELLESLKQVTNQMIAAVAREIDERRRAEAGLRKSQDLFQTFMENAPIGITIMGSDSTFEYINPTFTNLFGFTIEDIHSKGDWFEKAYPDPELRASVKALWKSDIKATSAGGEVQPRIFPVRCRDGSEKIVNFRAVFLQDGKQLTTYTDITDKAKAEQRIQESEEKYRTLVDNIQDGVFLVQDFTLRFVNDAFARMLGWSPDELIGIRFLDLVAPEDRQMLKENYVRRQAGEPVAREYEFSLLHRDGHTRVRVHINVDLLPFRGQVITIGTIKDITERIRADAEKKQLEARLQRSQKMEAIGTLAGGVAHDLNNILSGLVSYPELILMDLAPDSPLRRPILTIQKSGEKAAAIVQDLLTLARRGVAVTQVIDCNQIVAEYLASPEFEKLCEFHPGVGVQKDLEPGLLFIQGSAIHLSKTVMNLVSNAAEAMPEGGKVCLCTRNVTIDRPLRGYDEIQPGDYVVLSVQDTGVGIADKDLERIFEPFYTKKVMGRSGTGLGMAVVWGTVKDHRGHIDVQSTEGKGTAFTLYFPVTRKTMLPQATKLSLNAYRGRGETILVVDDMDEQRLIASEMLTKLGYLVLTASSGEEALSMLEHRTVDLMVLDMIMDPGIDGMETYRRVAALHPGQKAIIASGFSETDRVKEAQRLGVGRYVKKPYTLEKIGPAVRQALDRK